MLLALAAAAALFPGQHIAQLAPAPSANPVISQDSRYARLVAFEAGNQIVVVHRAKGYGKNGTPWHPGRREVVGEGISPSVDGDSHSAPHCVAFVSTASNLVPGDTNGTSDAFVRDLRTGVTRRVSVDSSGRQSTGSVSEVAIDGGCRRVAFVSNATDLALRSTKRRAWKTAVTQANPYGHRQVYVHAFGGHTRIDRALKGLTFLASATNRGRPGNADSDSIAYATNADRVTFMSSATGLSGHDHNGATDVYQRVMTRRYGRRIRGHRVQYLRMRTRLVSAGRDGRAGAGSSYQPASNVDGSVIAFGTVARDLVPTRGYQQVAKVKLRGRHPKVKLVSRARGGAVGNSYSVGPSVTAGGSWVIFESDATNIGLTARHQPDLNLVHDAILATATERWLLGERGAMTETTRPKTSAHGNYVVFQRGGAVDLLYVGPK